MNLPSSACVIVDKMVVVRRKMFVCTCVQK